jgi:hypothetical protein
LAALVALIPSNLKWPNSSFLCCSMEKYLGRKQKLREAVNDLSGLNTAKALVLPRTEQLK